MSVSQLHQALREGARVRTVGIHGGARGHVLARLAREARAPLWCLTRDDDEAEALARDLAFFLGGPAGRDGPTVLRLSGDVAPPWDAVVQDAAGQAERLGTLYQLAHGAKATALVCSWRAAARKLLPVEVVKGLSFALRAGEEHDPAALAARLAAQGYQHAPLVEDVGTFSRRGDILDVFPPLQERPVRLEFFGDALESLRTFDPGTQRTVEPLESLRILPARELFLSDATRHRAEGALRAAAEASDLPTSRVRERLLALRDGVDLAGLWGLWPAFFEGGLRTLFDYVQAWSPRRPLVWLDDPHGLEAAAAELTAEVERSHREALDRGALCLPPPAHYLSRDEVVGALAPFARVEGGGLALDLPDDAPPLPFAFGETRQLREQLRAHHGEEGALAPLLEQLGRWRDDGLAVVVACGGPGHLDRVKRLLQERDVPVVAHRRGFDDAEALRARSGAVHLFPGDLDQGFVDREAKLAVLCDEDLFGPRAKRRVRRRRPEGAFAATFQDLKPGDLVVHADFGVARYAGMTPMEVQGVRADFLVLEYAGKDKVYLPVSRLRLLSRFTAQDGGQVALDRLGSGGWDKTRARVKEKLLQLAAELIRLYAERKAHPGFAFSPPDRYFHQFEADFEFDETPDQDRAIDEVLADMQKPEPMDRLVCGDVGYGKTEVAMRAAFKAVLDHKQVAVLVPTTLLAHQHHATFTRRFQGYPVTIDVVSSLRKPAEVKEALRKAKEGRVDVLVGTHKLLGSSVAFKELGLLVVDEEQKFGVKQKEALKQLKAQVDVLTLSATPIPRTLNMALGGLRDLSLITTPPQDRRAIRTFVNRFDPAQIREAILREVHRGGQVFFVHNRVSSIHGLEQFLGKLVPEVKVVVAHGQMPEGRLEAVMLDFVQKRAQVLLCTSIIESGIDIPSANTLIVNRADAFGLAQLYQLRGRVGRSRERAWAYLLVPARRGITRDAEKRLEVLQTFSELGAGFHVASHDLEIRGAGNLLGDEQSGAIEAVGFELYTQLLEEAVAELRGEEPRAHVEPDVNLPLPAYLPEDFVPDVQQRLVLYKRFAQAQSDEELDDLRAEVVDRYGDAPDELDALCEVMRLKMSMRELRLRALDLGPARLVVTLGPDAALGPRKLAALVQRSQGFYRLTPELKLVARASFQAGAPAPGQRPRPPSPAEVLDLARRVLKDLLACAA